MRWEGWGNLFQEEKISAKTQGMIKRNHEIFGVFQNLEKKFSKYISLQIFFFSRENIFQEISSQILENPKNFMISFFSSPEF